MKIKSARYENDERGLPALVLVPTQADWPEAVISEEEASRWGARGWPGIFLGWRFEDLIPAASLGGKSFRGVDIDADIIKLARLFAGDVATGTYAEKELDVPRMLAG